MSGYSRELERQQAEAERKAREDRAKAAHAPAGEMAVHLSRAAGHESHARSLGRQAAIAKRQG
jgi:hypothetical protein